MGAQVAILPQDYIAQFSRGLRLQIVVAHMLSRLLVASSLVAALAHYGQPPCMQDEDEFRPYNFHAKVCAKKCTTIEDCPTDKPPDTWKAAPQCDGFNSTQAVCTLRCTGGFGCGKGEHCYSMPYGKFVC